ncbi:hypothetical protein Xedl_02235 [Xenorhabdus eapokensis]|uniref:Uncharacterized protein n=1 Tax=Xenorhabdus eapokensis TaxID=1873482 RepID=A0A1Q5TQT0_9GAMM|nr:hypothetical protein Xedl_02235 [Xenorhabdus eapokensis]
MPKRTFLVNEELTMSWAEYLRQQEKRRKIWQIATPEDFEDLSENDG